MVDALTQPQRGLCPHGLFLESKGRLKACVQVSDDLLYFRGHSTRYQLNTVGNTVLFDRVSLDVAQQAVA